MRDILLEAAIAHEQVQLAFQPVIDARTGAIVAAEALARSTVASGPEKLFSRASAARLDERLSRLVQRKALHAAAVWEGHLKGLGISINLLVADISRDGYDRWLLEAIDAAAIDPARVMLEITEGALIADCDRVSDRLTVLRDHGIRIAVDDFGTGYSSLAYLTSLPLDCLKIDRGLICGMVDSERGGIVVEALLRLAGELGLKTIAEGVETAEQLSFLQSLGADYYQGYFASQPLEQVDLTCFAERWSLQAA